MSEATWPNITYDYSGMEVLVTGGSSGIGTGIAAAYAAAGANVTITGTRASADDYDNDLSAYRYLQLRLTENNDIQGVADAIPQLDILINNAGSNMPKSEYDPDVFEEALRVNLASFYRMSAAFHDKLGQSKFPGGASVMGIASMTSYFGNDWVPGYGAAKAGLVQLVKTLSMAWAKDNIRVNTVAAGLIESNMTAAMLKSDKLIKPFIERTPLSRVGTPHDIAGAVLFMTSPAASFITGHTLPVDGGYSIA
ncbi:MAG: SDR family oxidoreductase [Deltaproteobacteria bacterium]|nr:SDR family oxidoreductase [Deltaproteobacteria bacterium]